MDILNLLVWYLGDGDLLGSDALRLNGVALRLNGEPIRLNL